MSSTSAISHHHGSFLVQQFLENAAEVQGEKPWSLPAGSEIPCAILFGTRRKGVRKATAFRGESGQDRFPLVNDSTKQHFENVPVGHFQRNFPQSLFKSLS